MPTQIYSRHMTTLLSVLTLGLSLAGCPGLEPADLSPRPEDGSKHLFRLAHISDPQIADEESPARTVRFADVLGGAWRPQEAFGIHTLDATLQVINQIHETDERPIDFTIVTGDLTDSAQVNELQWYVDTMDGKVVTADSGALDGSSRNVPAELNPKLPYDAVGLDPDIPWYTCFGNHDGLAVGNFAIDRSPAEQNEWFAPLLIPVADLVGLHDFDPQSNELVATAAWSPAVLLGSGIPLLSDGLNLDLDSLQAGPIVADPERRFLSHRDFVSIHLNSDSLPLGHGFDAMDQMRGNTWYSANPVSGQPLRLIVFDSVAENEHYGIPFYFGILTRKHFEAFILPEIIAASRAGEWVILASHHPPSDFDLGFAGDNIGTAEFRRRVGAYGNVILHLIGHTHRHRAEIIPGPYPYLEIETAAIIDFPQEGRLLDVFLEEDGRTLRVESRLFSHIDAPTTFSAESYRRAAAIVGSGKSQSQDDVAGTPQRDHRHDRAFTLRLSR